MRKLLLTFFLLISVNCFADDPRNLVSYPPEKILGFRGIDTSATAPTLADGRAVDLLNVKLSSAFDIRKRYGYSVVNSTLDDYDISSPAVTGIFDAEYSTGSRHLLSFVGSKLKYDNSGTWTTVSGTATITTGQDNQWQCVMAFDSAICTNDVDVPLKVNTTPTKSVLDVSDLTDTLTKVKSLAWYRNYLILANTVENSVSRPTRFRWSDVGTIEDYSNDNFVDIATYAGDEIIAVKELYAELYIFLKSSIWKASYVGGDEIFVFRKVVEGIGAIARDSVQTVTYTTGQNEIIFLNKEKRILSFDGVRAYPIDLTIQNTLLSLNETRLKYAVGVFDGLSYYLSVTTGSELFNDTVYEYQTEIKEWSIHDQIDANAFARVDDDSEIKTYFGNYGAFVYWLDNPDNKSDVDGAVGVFDSTGIVNTATLTGALAIIDMTMTTGIYTGAIVKITSGTGAGEEAIVLTNLTGGTGVAVELDAFDSFPDSTSIYSIGAIDASYTGKWYDMGNSSKEKAFLGMLFWAEENSNNSVDITHAIDFGSIEQSVTKDLSPASASLWDSALWDESVWATTGDKIYTVKYSGFGNFIQPSFENDSIDETFHIYGFNLLGTMQDVKQ